MGTYLGPGKTEKNPPPNPPPPHFKGKNERTLEGMPGPSHWLHEISLPKKVHHHFWPELYPSKVQLFFVKFDWHMPKKLKL